MEAITIGAGENVVRVKGTDSRVLVCVGDEIAALTGPEARSLLEALKASIAHASAESAGDADRRVERAVVPHEVAIANGVECVPHPDTTKSR